MSDLQDRRGEFSDIEHLLMQLGLMEQPMQDAEFRKQNNLGPGEWLDYEDPNRRLPVTALGVDAGSNDLDNQYMLRGIGGTNSFVRPRGNR